MRLSEEMRREIEALKRRYPEPRSALMGALRLAQEEYGWLDPALMEEVAEVMGLSPAEVGSVASFYTMFYRQPVGRHVIQVCTNVTCSMMGAEALVDYLRRRLGVEVGETTPDGRFTLLTVECLGSCGTAPVMQVDATYYDRLTPERVEEILARLEREDEDRGDVG